MHYARSSPSETVPLDLRLLDDAEWLHDAYLERGKSLRSIADALGTSHATVWRRLVKHGIPRRRGRHSGLACTKRSWLEQHYVAEGRSLRECAAMAGSSHETVRYWLRVHGLPVRDLHEAVTTMTITPYP